MPAELPMYRLSPHSVDVGSYVGLMREAVGLARDWATIERDKLEIRAAYELRVTEVTARIAEQETALAGELEERRELRRMLHEQIMAAFAAKEYQLANILNGRMMAKFEHSAIPDLIALFNRPGGGDIGQPMIEFRPRL